MNDQPLAIPDASPEVIRGHYEHLRQHLIWTRAKKAGLLSSADHRLIDRARLEAHVELGRLREGR